MVTLLLWLYSVWEALGALRILLGLLPLLIICIIAAPIDIYRWFRDRKKRARAAERLADFERRLAEKVAEAEMRKAEEEDDYDENGVRY